MSKESSRDILVVGNGGREHTLVWKICQAPSVGKVYCAPGNPGIARLAECVSISADDLDGLAAFADQHAVDLTVVGPESPLVAGIVDRFTERGLMAFGPSQRAAALEGSKVFAKELMRKWGIPTAQFARFTERVDALDYLKAHGAPIVIKASGLAAGKGSIVAMTQEEAAQAIEGIMGRRMFGQSGDEVVIEEFMEGEEASILALTDGETIAPLVSSQDHKRVFDGDEGLNTGGMGAYAPAPVMSPELLEQVTDQILRPTIEAMKEEGRPYKGVLYAGLMITDEGPKVVEFNCRFGDPECQVVLPLLESDLVEAMEAVCEGRLNGVPLRNADGAAVCVVLASGGYPGPYEKGKVISGLERLETMDGVMVFHAGTAEKDGQIVSNGGRVLGITATGRDVRSAIDRAYEAAARVSFEGMHYRRDIGYRALARLEGAQA